MSEIADKELIETFEYDVRQNENNDTFTSSYNVNVSKNVLIDEFAALRAQLAEVQAEVERLNNREISLLSHIKTNGKRLQAGKDIDFDQYVATFNAGYIDGLIFQHNEAKP